jgi:hypothetical protein
MSPGKIFCLDWRIREIVRLPKMTDNEKAEEIGGGEASASGGDCQPGIGAIQKRRYRLFIVIGAAIIVILGVTAVPYYQKYVAPFNRTVITVDNTHISMRYFLERIKFSGSDPMNMLNNLTREQVIKLAAPQYGIQVSDADIDKRLRYIASGGKENISEEEFREWYRQQLNENNLSDSQYRDLVHNDLLASHLQEYLAERTPRVAEQVHLNAIVVQTHEEAQKVVARLKAGESFASVARKVSMDPSSKDKGGDLGWLPLAVSPFSAHVNVLHINEASEPIPYSSKPMSTPSPADEYLILMVSEKDSSRQLDADGLKILQSRALELWLPGEIHKHSIKYNMNSETMAWVEGQLQKR